MSGIFISYRREETAAYAGRLRDRLIQEFGEDQVFMDVDTIELGVDFTQVIENAVSDVDVLLCIMGPDWASLSDDSGRRRLDDPADFVRLEVSSALERDIRIIPVLVKSARMPGVDELPSELSALVKRNALQLGDVRFHADVDVLIRSLRRLLDERPGTREHRGSKSTPILKWLAISVVLILVAGGAWYVWDDYRAEIDAKRKDRAGAAKAQQQYDDVQNLYAAHKSTEDCARIRRIVAGIERYYSERYLVPERHGNTVRYPRRIEQPTIADLARDRSIRIRRVKAQCF